MKTLLTNPYLMQLATSSLGITESDFQELTPEELDELGAVMLKDETTCIQCAMCASRCPTHAITIQRFEFSCECVSIPAPNPKIKCQLPRRKRWSLIGPAQCHMFQMAGEPGQTYVDQFQPPIRKG